MKSAGDSAPCASPPSYSLQETKHGHLVNRHLRLLYPNRPKTGYHSKAEHEQRKKKDEIRRRNERIIRGDAPVFEDSSSELAEVFKGALSREQAERMVEADEFILFYLIEFSVEPSMKMKLHIATRDEGGDKAWMFEVCRSSAGDWSVLYGDPRPPSFDSLLSLARYYSLYRNLSIKESRMTVLPYLPPSPCKDSVFTDGASEHGGGSPASLASTPRDPR